MNQNFIHTIKLSLLLPLLAKPVPPQKHGFQSNILLKAIGYNKAKLDGRWSIVDGQ